MKKLLIQLDSDKHPSSFDRIVAYDAGADEVLSYGGVTVADVRGLIQSAFFTRGIPDLNTIAAWIGGSDVALGEQLLAEAQRAFFGPFKISLMLDSNGCNTTATTAIAKLARQLDPSAGSGQALRGRTAVVIGPGPVGTRAALLLAREGCQVTVVSVPPDLLGARYNPELAQRTLANARQVAEAFASSAAEGSVGSLRVAEVPDRAAMEGYLEGAEIAVAAGPAGLQMLPHAFWAPHPTLRWLLDFNLTEPLGIEKIKPSDDFKEREGKRVLGPLAIGNPKMTVHKACIAKLFERNDLVLDAEGVYELAKGLV